MTHRLARTAALAVVAVVVALLPGAASAAPPRIYDTYGVDAPIGERGGIMSPHVECASYRTDPQVTWKVRNTATGRTRRFSWEGIGPGWHFPRLPVGRYRLTTVATCGDDRARHTQTVRILQKTRRGTVSRREFRQVRRGMSPRRVRRIIGNGGRDQWRYQGRTTRTYDMMAFWRYSTISYRNGRVVAKSWDVAHDRR